MKATQIKANFLYFLFFLLCLFLTTLLSANQIQDILYNITMSIRMQVSLHNIPNSCATVAVYQQPLARDNICLCPVLPTYEVQLKN